MEVEDRNYLILTLKRWSRLQVLGVLKKYEDIIEIKENRGENLFIDVFPPDTDDEGVITFFSYRINDLIQELIKTKACRRIEYSLYDTHRIQELS